MSIGNTSPCISIWWMSRSHVQLWSIAFLWSYLWWSTLPFTYSYLAIIWVYCFEILQVFVVIERVGIWIKIDLIRFRLYFYGLLDIFQCLFILLSTIWAILTHDHSINSILQTVSLHSFTSYRCLPYFILLRLMLIIGSPLSSRIRQHIPLSNLLVSILLSFLLFGWLPALEFAGIDCHQLICINLWVEKEVLLHEPVMSLTIVCQAFHLPEQFTILATTISFIGVDGTVEVGATTKT